jgi:hypothetical protein
MIDLLYLTITLTKFALLPYATTGCKQNVRTGHARWLNPTHFSRVNSRTTTTFSFNFADKEQFAST